MTEEITQPQEGQVTPPTASTPAALPAAVPPLTPPVVPPAVEPDDDEAQPDPRIRKANEEAKRYRLQLRETEGQLKTLTERLEALEKSQSEANQRAETERQARLRIEAAAANGLPPESAKFLNGSTPEEINAAAVELARLMPNRASRLGNTTDSPPQSRAKEIYERIGGQHISIFDPAVQRRLGGGESGEPEKE